MKKLFLSLVAVLMATVSFAQNTLVATLSHGEDITMYYGRYALRDAMNAAQSGDVINLSGGEFEAVDITKAVTLRGTGIDDASPTYIKGSFTMTMPTDDANRLTMEGIRCIDAITFTGTWSNPYFLKCCFRSFSYSKNSSTFNVKNATFANCKIVYYYYLGNNSTVLFINSYVCNFRNNFESTATASFINCLIESDSPNYIYSSYLLNCILYHTSTSTNSSSLPSTSVAFNCVAIGFRSLFSEVANNSRNNVNLGINDYAKVFKTLYGYYLDPEDFELTDEAKTKYLGTDGTQVGLYGGLLPYSSTPSYPQITKMNVANKTTADGKLSVEIEVSAAE